MLSYWCHVRYVLCRNAADLPALQAALDGTATSLPELQQGAYAGGNTAGEKAAFLWERVPLLLPEGFERSGADGSAEFEMPQVRLCVHTWLSLAQTETGRVSARVTRTQHCPAPTHLMTCAHALNNLCASLLHAADKPSKPKNDRRLRPFQVQ